MTQAIATREQCAMLSKDEKRDLAKYEQKISRGWATLIEVGEALAAVRDDPRKLYREYGTFDDYCKAKWEIGADYARKRIRSAEVVGVLKNDTTVSLFPATETQVRPLTTIDLEQVGDVWQEVVDRAPKDEAGNPKITAKHVEQTVKWWKSANEPYSEDDQTEDADDFDRDVEALKAREKIRRMFHDWPEWTRPLIPELLKSLAREDNSEW